MANSVMISLQPFWNLERKDTSLLTDEKGRPLAQCVLLHSEDSVQECVPGIGIIGLSFSCDPNRPAAYCYGVLEGRGEIDLNGLSDCFMARFLPGEFTRLFGCSSLLPPRNGVPLEELFPIGNLAEEMALAKTQEARMELIERLIRAREDAMLRLKGNDCALTQGVVSAILSRNGDIRMKELEQETCYSARYLQTVVQDTVGLAPKQLCSQIRFQSVLHLIQSGRSPVLTDLAQQAGFYDQSHLTRVFKEYTGMSPSAFLRTGAEQQKGPGVR